MADLSIVKSRLSAIQPLRALFLQELSAQVRYDAAHARPGTAEYRIRRDGRDIGYGSLKDTQAGRGTVFESYLVPRAREAAADILRELIRAANADTLECQTDDRFYTALVRQMAGDVTSDTWLFGAGPPVPSSPAAGVFRRRGRRDRVFRHLVEPVGDFVIDVAGDIVATGGFLLHYNPPFADVFMEVRADARRLGYGTALVRGVIDECYLAGRVPAARCGVDNPASRATLLRAGMVESGRMLRVGLSHPEGR